LDVPGSEVPRLSVSRLYIHPVKGLAAVPVRTLELDEVGPVGDRRWMVVADGGERFITQRTHPAMSLVEAVLGDDGGLRLRARGAPELSVEEPGTGAPRLRVRIWKDVVEAAPASEPAHEWFSEVLKEPVRLVRLPDDVVRPVDRARAREGFAGRVGFADGFPILLLGEASVADLDRRVPAGAPRMGVERFRPNVVVEGTVPWEEDRWRRVRIGTTELALVKPCARCVVITVDPRTGEKGDEPLATLSSFRRRDGKVWVGQNAVHRSPGTLSVGDSVTVLEVGSARPELDLAETSGGVD
jgi:uncharacterized protein YcbX